MPDGAREPSSGMSFVWEYTLGPLYAPAPGLSPPPNSSDYASMMAVAATLGDNNGAQPCARRVIDAVNALAATGAFHALLVNGALLCCCAAALVLLLCGQCVGFFCCSERDV